MTVPPANPLRPMASRPAPQSDAPALRDRCSAEMFHMHAVWRCPFCGVKTDCCGW